MGIRGGISGCGLVKLLVFVVMVVVIVGVNLVVDFGDDSCCGCGDVFKYFDVNLLIIIGGGIMLKKLKKWVVKGFILVEMMIVLFIISLLILIIVFNLGV